MSLAHGVSERCQKSFTNYIIGISLILKGITIGAVKFK